MACVTGLASDDAYRWGINAKLSGPLALYGETIRDRVKACVEDVNANGGINGHKIKLTVLNNPADAARATTNAAQLSTSSKVNAMFGPALGRHLFHINGHDDMGPLTLLAFLAARFRPARCAPISSSWHPRNPLIATKATARLQSCPEDA